LSVEIARFFAFRAGFENYAKNEGKFRPDEDKNCAFGKVGFDEFLHRTAIFWILLPIHQLPLIKANTF
jgi:hypothetical protein